MQADDDARDVCQTDRHPEIAHARSRRDAHVKIQITHMYIVFNGEYFTVQAVILRTQRQIEQQIVSADSNNPTSHRKLISLFP